MSSKVSKWVQVSLPPLPPIFLLNLSLLYQYIYGKRNIHTSNRRLGGGRSPLGRPPPVTGRFASCVCGGGVAVRWKCNATRFPVSLLRQELLPFPFRALLSSYDFQCFRMISIGFEWTVQVTSNDFAWFQVTSNEIKWVQLCLFSSGYKYVQSISGDFKWFHMIPIAFTQF